MPSPIFNQQNQQRPNFMSALNQLKQNPAQILGMKYNIPQGMTNPEERESYRSAIEHMSRN